MHLHAVPPGRSHSILWLDAIVPVNISAWLCSALSLCIQFGMPAKSRPTDALSTHSP